MENSTQEILSKQLASLPDEFKEAIKEAKISEKIISICEEQGLDAQQTNSIIFETTLLLLGISDSTQLASNISEEARVDAQKTGIIINNLNERVLKVIQQKLKDQKSQTDGLTRDQILEGIENPTPTSHPITVDTGGPAVPKEVIAEKKESVANDFIAGKLTETMNLPPKRAEIKPEPTLQNPNPEIPKPKYSADPYREPLQ